MWLIFWARNYSLDPEWFREKFDGRNLKNEKLRNSVSRFPQELQNNFRDLRAFFAISIDEIIDNKPSIDYNNFYDYDYLELIDEHFIEEIYCQIEYEKWDTGRQKYSWYNSKNESDIFQKNTKTISLIISETSNKARREMNFPKKIHQVSLLNFDYRFSKFKFTEEALDQILYRK